MISNVLTVVTSAKHLIYFEWGLQWGLGSSACWHMLHTVCTAGAAAGQNPYITVNLQRAC